ncbi:MAG TPA: TetR family transcriptional regulator [Sphingopyxis terrae]|nr:TetR family transcriptional regulator [Sphingopyxis terrae]
MVSREEQRARVEAALAAHLLDHGLAQTSLRELARAAAVSDRMLLYYFADKAEVLGCAAQRIAADLAGHIGEAVGEGERLAPLALLERAGALVTRAEIRPYMRLWVQMIAAAGRGEAPFPAIAEAMLAGFLAWVEAHLAIDEAADRQAKANQAQHRTEADQRRLTVSRSSTSAAGPISRRAPRALSPISVVLADRGT